MASGCRLVLVVYPNIYKVYWNEYRDMDHRIRVRGKAFYCTSKKSCHFYNGQDLLYIQYIDLVSLEPPDTIAKYSRLPVQTFHGN